MQAGQRRGRGGRGGGGGGGGGGRGGGGRRGGLEREGGGAEGGSGRRVGITQSAKRGRRFLNGTPKVNVLLSVDSARPDELCTTRSFVQHTTNILPTARRVTIALIFAMHI